MNLTDHRATVLVYVDAYRDHVPEGSFVTLPDQERYRFRGLDQLLLILEDLMDAAAEPEEGGTHRYLYQDQAPYVFLEPEGFCADQEPGVFPADRKPGIPSRMPGQKAMFTIQVSYRQHGSMQGRLSYPAGGVYGTVSFRSALELMRMLHEHLSREMVPDKEEAGV